MQGNIPTIWWKYKTKHVWWNYGGHLNQGDLAMRILIGTRTAQIQRIRTPLVQRPPEFQRNYTDIQSKFDRIAYRAREIERNDHWFNPTSF